MSSPGRCPTVGTRSLSAIVRHGGSLTPHRRGEGVRTGTPAMRAVSGSADHPHPQVGDLVERGDVQWLEAYIRAAGEVEQPGAIAQQDGRDDYQDGVEVASLQALASDVGAEHGDVAVTGRCLGRASASTKESRKVTPARARPAGCA